jgi:hypothetical protein
LWIEVLIVRLLASGTFGCQLFYEKQNLWIFDPDDGRLRQSVFHTSAALILIEIQKVGLQLSLQSGSKEEKGQPPGKLKESVAKSRAGVPSKTEKEKEKKSVVEKENTKSQKKKGLSLVKGDDQKPVDSGKAEVRVLRNCLP